MASSVVSIVLLLLSSPLCGSFSRQAASLSKSRRPPGAPLHVGFQGEPTPSPDERDLGNGDESSGGSVSTVRNEAGQADQSNKFKLRPSWVPMELVELAAEDLEMSSEDFVSIFADVEAYTSCDDEGDGLHECDFFGQYLGPTKWLRLKPAAYESVDQAHFVIWKEVWSHPHCMVNVADEVSKKTLRYYEECMLEDCTEQTPSVRAKVVPASFGLDGFEEAVWEATETILRRSDSFASETLKTLFTVDKVDSLDSSTGSDHNNTNYSALSETKVTFVIAAPDLADPILMEGRSCSPQAEFSAECFERFTSSLREKLVLFSKLEGIPFDEAIRLTPFHPMWRSDINPKGNFVQSTPFPYPCVALSIDDV